MWPIKFHSLEWDRRRIQSHTSRGSPYAKWIPCGMPRIPDDVLNSVFFMYRQTNDADKGINACGTGFVAGYPCSHPRLKKLFHFYAVSNAHVVEDAPVIRLNRRDGSTETFGNDSGEWEIDQRSDIAVLPLEIAWREYGIHFLGKDFFIDKHFNNDVDVGLGDDIFMIGYFQDHGDVQERNTPFARFGHISMVPPDPNGDHKKDISYCVDMRSRAGFSGSPVFIYRNVGTNIKAGVESGINDRTSPGFMRLLGIDWGSFKEKWVIEGDMVNAEGISGMAIVTPAWDILKVLERDRFMKQREETESKMPTPTIQEDSASVQKNDRSSNKEDFIRLLSEAVSNPPTDD